ncbi:MAG: TetR/AcrR family transcriptional regulator [Coriobacteriia bacterium]|nr:TetR/AcrR family transcriptional regulator [Coriobacteriia bacterium]
MARPRSNALDAPLEDRIEEAFWELVQENAPERISIVALSKQAHCNRGTFYYYFTDIYDLLDRLIEKNLPRTISRHVLSYMAGKESADDLEVAVREENDHIEKLGILLTRSESNYCAEKLKATLIDVWCLGTGTRLEDMNQNDYLLFEFMASGVLGMLAYTTKNGSYLNAKDIIMALAPEIPQAIIARVKRRQQEKQAAKKATAC